MIEITEGMSMLERRKYVEAENKAHAELVKNGYTPQGINSDFKSVCVMKFEHPEHYNNPVKCGKCEVFQFKNWQEAAETLLK